MPEQKSTSHRRPVRSSEQDQLAQVGRLQPQAVELERAVIGACLIEQDAFATVSDFLKPQSFYESKHQVIFQAIQSLAASNAPIDVLTVVDQLQKNGDLDNAGGAAYIAELSRSMLSAAHLEFHARIVAQKALARDLISYTSTIQKLAFDDGQDIQELMQMAEGKLFELSKSNLKKDFTQIDPVINEAYDLLHKAAARADGLSGLSSGFDKLDAMTSGWQNSDLVIIAARPAMGKTAFVLSMARNMVVDKKIPVAMFSLEMSNVQLVNRLLVNVCEIPGEKIKSGQLLPHEWQQLDYKMRELYGVPFYVDDTPSLSVFELRTKARRLVRDYGVQMIIIDYLQLMNASGMSYNSRQEEVSTISRSLKAAHSCPECEKLTAENSEEISGHGMKCTLSGKTVLAGNTRLMEKESVSVSGGSDDEAATAVHVALDGKYAGLITLSDVAKEDAKEAISSLKKMGVKKTVMLTGDTKAVAEKVGEELGLDEVYSELLPNDKVERIEELLNKDGTVLFVGDGINDAPVLMRSDVGIAMGGMGSDAAIEAADVVIMDDKPSRVSEAIKSAKGTMSVVWQNVAFALGVKILIIALCSIGLANMWLAVFGDVGVTMIAVLNAMRPLIFSKKK